MERDDDVLLAAKVRQPGGAAGVIAKVEVGKELLERWDRRVELPSYKYLRGL